MRKRVAKKINKNGAKRYNNKAMKKLGMAVEIFMRIIDATNT